MIVVTIEMWPHGQQESSKILGVCTISNDLSGTKELGNYKVSLSHSGKYIERKGTWKTGKVKNHKRNLSPYHLVYKALRACLFKPEAKANG